MKQKGIGKKLWVAIRVERGFICKAKIYESLAPARRAVRRWKSRLNPDYDEASVIEAS
jgi:hypothetical protein